MGSEKPLQVATQGRSPSTGTSSTIFFCWQMSFELFYKLSWHTGVKVFYIVIHIMHTICIIVLGNFFVGEVGEEIYFLNRRFRASPAGPPHLITVRSRNDAISAWRWWPLASSSSSLWRARERSFCKLLT
jgi:hypothetical protein